MALFKAMDTLGTGIVSNQAHYKSIHLDYHKQQISYLYIYLACVAGKTRWFDTGSKPWATSAPEQSTSGTVWKHLAQVFYWLTAYFRLHLPKKFPFSQSFFQSFQ